MDELNKSLSITFILPVLNETDSLQWTVETILELCRKDLQEILVVIADRTTKESLAIIDKTKKQHPGCIRVYKQKLPFLGGAMREAFDVAAGDYVMLMATDLETDPRQLPVFAEIMRNGSWDIVVASRWAKGGGFEGYNKIKLILNYVFQQIFRTLYFTRLTDLTFAYRLYRKSVLEGIVWEELKHPFLLECLVKPLRCGARVTEIPCKWQARTEGASANTLLETFKYLRIAFKTRFIPIRRLKIRKIQ